MALHEAFAAGHFSGFCETVPAYSSLAVFYDAATVKKHHLPAGPVFDLVKEYTERLMAGLADEPVQKNKNLITVPVHYNGDDLDEVAKLHNISMDELVRIHTAKTYRVFMTGFQPGFPYMGKLDERIITPRKTVPRTKVPAGSVGIAGSQTGIYPFSSPGGWQLLGQTPLKLFDKEKAQPCLFSAGDHITFISISREEFKELNEY